MVLPSLLCQLPGVATHGPVGWCTESRGVLTGVLIPSTLHRDTCADVDTQALFLPMLGSTRGHPRGRLCGRLSTHLPLTLLQAGRQWLMHGNECMKG